MEDANVNWHGGLEGLPAENEEKSEELAHPEEPAACLRLTTAQVPVWRGVMVYERPLSYF